MRIAVGVDILPAWKLWLLETATNGWPCSTLPVGRAALISRSNAISARLPAMGGQIGWRGTEVALRRNPVWTVKSGGSLATYLRVEVAAGNVMTDMKRHIGC